MEQKDGRIYGIIRRMMIVIGIILIVLLSAKGIVQTGKGIDKHAAAAWLADCTAKRISGIWGTYYPSISWQEKSSSDSQEEKKHKEESIGSFLSGLLFGGSPIYRFFGNDKQADLLYEEADPAFKSYIENGRFYEEHQFLMYDGGEESGEDGSGNPGAMAGSGSVLTDGQIADGGANETDSIIGTSEPDELPAMAGNTAGTGALPIHLTTAQKDTSMISAENTFWPVTGKIYRIEQLADYDYLMKHFYSVHTSTTAGRSLMNAEQFLAEDFTLEGTNEKPQILIYHTHSQETFADYGPNNQGATVVGMGNYLTELLTAKGYSVIHDTSVYDFRNGKLDRNKAYGYALDGITDILQKNPSIEVVLDLHRDGVNEKLHMVNDVNGKPTAPIMFFNGISQTPEGPIEYLSNPYKEKNLAFSFQLQLDADAYFPNLTRKIYLKGLRYNLHLRPRSALVEVGAQTNTYQEALNAMEPLAEVLDMVLQGN